MERHRGDEGISNTSLAVAPGYPQSAILSNTDSLTMPSSCTSSKLFSIMGGCATDTSSGTGDRLFLAGLSMVVSKTPSRLTGRPRGGPPGYAGHAEWQLGQQYCSSCVGLLSFNNASSEKAPGVAASRT